MKTLLLNANYFPIRVIPWDRAVKMKFEGTADVVAEYQDEVRSPSVTWKIPAVIRERRKVKVKHVVRFSRRNVFMRDDFRCQYCGERFDDSELTYDHVIPRAHGGKTSWENIVSACYDCNGRKGSRDCDEVGMFPLKQPKRPTWLPVLGPNIKRETAPPEWLAWLPT